MADIHEYGIFRIAHGKFSHLVVGLDDRYRLVAEKEAEKASQMWLIRRDRKLGSDHYELLNVGGQAFATYRPRNDGGERGSLQAIRCPECMPTEYETWYTWISLNGSCVNENVTIFRARDNNSKVRFCWTLENADYGLPVSLQSDMGSYGSIGIKEGASWTLKPVLISTAMLAKGQHQRPTEVPNPAPFGAWDAQRLEYESVILALLRLNTVSDESKERYDYIISVFEGQLEKRNELWEEEKERYQSIISALEKQKELSGKEQAKVKSALSSLQMRERAWAEEKERYESTVLKLRESDKMWGKEKETLELTVSALQEQERSWGAERARYESVVSVHRKRERVWAEEKKKYESKLAVLKGLFEDV